MWTLIILGLIVAFFVGKAILSKDRAPRASFKSNQHPGRQPDQPTGTRPRIQRPADDQVYTSIPLSSGQSHPADDVPKDSPFVSQKQTTATIKRAGIRCEYPNPQRCVKRARFVNFVIPKNQGGATSVFNLFACCEEHSQIVLTQQDRRKVRILRSSYFPPNEHKQTGFL